MAMATMHHEHKERGLEWVPKTISERLVLTQSTLARSSLLSVDKETQNFETPRLSNNEFGRKGAVGILATGRINSITFGACGSPNETEGKGNVSEYCWTSSMK
jgi:hypothetical protein